MGPLTPITTEGIGGRKWQCSGNCHLSLRKTSLINQVVDDVNDLCFVCVSDSASTDRKPPVWSSLASSLARTASGARSSVLMTTLVMSLLCHWRQ